MSQINKLTYSDKENVVPVEERKKQATAEDFNEIKTVVNNCVDGINWIKSNEHSLVAGTNTIEFLSPYPVGVPFALTVINCIDSKGYWVAHTITDKNNSGFTVTVEKDCTLFYLSTPRR